MTDKFINQSRIVVTPLSPIHIGSGEDLIPTNYYMDNGFIHIFDPFKLKLPGDKISSLLNYVKNSTFSDVYNFFYENRELLRSGEISVIPVDSEIEGKYKRILNSSSSDAKCLIARTAVTAMRGFDQPYIPGSSLKGAFHTAILNKHADHNQYYNKNFKFDKELLNASSFEKSPMRFLKVSDLMPATTVYSRVIKSVRNTKRRGPIKSYVEVIDKAQYRAFEGTISLYSAEKCGLKKDKLIESINAVSECMKTFYFKKNRGIIKSYKEWKDIFFNLENSLKDDFIKGKCFIARLGKYQGKASVTLDVKGINAATTYTKAYESLESDNTLELPFGYVLVEVDPVGENKALKDYCECCRASMKDFKLKDVREKLLQGKV